MLRPRMWAFTFDGDDPHELPLDIAAVPSDAVAFFDSWYTLLLHNGSHVASWIKQARVTPAKSRRRDSATGDCYSDDVGVCSSHERCTDSVLCSAGVP